MNKTKTLAGCMLALSLAVAGLFCSKGEIAISKDTHGIVVRGNSAMRIDPMVFTGIIAYLKKGEIVQILERSSVKAWVGKENDFWYRVKIKDGTTGWVFGQTITIYASENKIVMDKMVSEFMDVEIAQAKKGLAGKWWSTNEFGDFTDHCIEIYDNGKYRSYKKEQESEAISGTYKIDFKNNTIGFSAGTSFKSDLDLIKRGSVYIIKKTKNDKELRFSRIAIDIPSEPETIESNVPKARSEKNGNPAQ